MTNRDRYDELELFEDKLLTLKYELESKDLIEIINSMLYDTGIIEEKEELERLLANEYEEEINELNREYRKMQEF